MLQVEFGGLEPLVANIDELKKRIEGLYVDVPEEFIAWQSDDMHRQEPWSANRVRRNSLRAKLILRPHSYKTVKSRAAHRAARRAAARARHRRSGVGRFRGSSGPILRPELFELLCSRMAELLKKTVTWK